MSKFTGGDWTWSHDESTSSMIQIESSSGVVICRLQSEDNAHLLTASPKMYAALEAISMGEGLPPGTTIEGILLEARGES